MTDTPNTAKSYLSEAFKEGVQKQWGHEVIYLDSTAINIEHLKKNIAEKDREAIGSHIAKQIDANGKEISKLFDHDTLAGLTRKTMNGGPFAQKLPNDAPVCIISPPKENEFKPSQVYRFFGITDNFSHTHLKPIPGTQQDWEKFIGEHEGEHCNQKGFSKFDSDHDVKELDGEIRSDRAAIESLRAEGKHKVADAVIAVRILAASLGDTEHATSIFLNKKDYTGITKDHYDAAKRFTDEMLLTVCDSEKMSMVDAFELRLSNPQKFAKMLEKGIKNGHYPARRQIDEEEMMQMLSKQMGTSLEDFKSSGVSRISEINHLYKKMDSDGKFLDRGKANPHIETYIKQYIEVTKKYFIANTAPSLAKNQNQDNDQSTTIDFNNDDAKTKPLSYEDKLRRDTDFGRMRVMDEIVSKALNLDKKKPRNSLAKIQINITKLSKQSSKKVRLNSKPSQNSHKIKSIY